MQVESGHDGCREQKILLPEQEIVEQTGAGPEKQHGYDQPRQFDDPAQKIDIDDDKDDVKDDPDALGCERIETGQETQH